MVLVGLKFLKLNYSTEFVAASWKLGSKSFALYFGGEPPASTRCQYTQEFWNGSSWTES